MRKVVQFLLVCMAIWIGSCAPSRFVKPLAKDQKSVDFHLGGEMVHFSGLVIPVPFTSVTGGYGVKDDLTAFASFYITDLAYQNVHIDGGVVKQLYQSPDSSVGVTVTPQLNFVYGLAEGKTKIWPQIDANAYWHYKKGKQHFAYGGMSNWFEFASTRAHAENQPTFWLPNFHLGHQFTKSKVDYFTEVKYIAPFIENGNVTVDYWKPLGMKKGAIGVYVGIRKKF